MTRILEGRIAVLPSKSRNGDDIPGVIETHQVHESTGNRYETAFQPRLSFLPDALDDNLRNLFDAGKLTTPVAVSVDVDDSQGVFSKVTRIQKR